MQRNSATYCDEPDDAAAFSAFLEGYDQEARTTQAAEVLSSNPFMSELHSRLVPLVITDDTFWQRYFFRCEPCVPLVVAASQASTQCCCAMLRMCLLRC